ncbi:MAG TPA: peptidase S8, partial [Pyrodictium sp.]|nr:peptidase S8 [Pyrodictium sp.]
LTLLPPGTETDMDTSTIRGILHATAVDAGAVGYDELYGYGIINAYEAVNAALQ